MQERVWIQEICADIWPKHLCLKWRPEVAHALARQYPELGCAHLGHGVAHAQGEYVTEHVDLGVALVELGRAVVPHKSVDDRLGVLEHLEQIAGKKTRYQSPEIIPEYFEFF